MSLEKSIKKIEKDIDKLLEKADAPIKEVGDFIKGHKKILITLAIIYLVYRYLFEEDSDY